MRGDPIHFILITAAFTAASLSVFLSPSGPPGPVTLAVACIPAAAALIAALRGRSRGRNRVSAHIHLVSAALAFTAVRIAGGYEGPLFPLYFILLGWMAHPSVSGPALETGLVLGVLEGLLIVSGNDLLSPGLLDRVVRGIEPFLCLPAFSLGMEWFSESARSSSITGDSGKQPSDPGWERIAELLRSVAPAGSLSRAIHATAAWLAGSGEGLTVTIGLLSSDGKMLDIYESLGPLAPGRVGRAFDLEGSVAGWTINTFTAISRNGLSSGGRPVMTLSRQDPSNSGCGSCSTSPIPASDRCIGLILVESESSDGTGESVEPALDLCSRLLGLTIEKILLREQRKDLQNRDGLTGLPRLVDFIDFVRRTSRDVYRFGRSVSLFVVGLDSLKEINASLGFSSGDRLIAACGSKLSDLAGSEACVTRFSGAKFAVCIPGMDAAGAEAFAESLIRAFDGMKIRLESGEATPGICVGAAVTRSDRRVESLCPEASRMLVRARISSTRFVVSELQASQQASSPSSS